MTKFLEKLITEDTPILEIQNNDNISYDEKIKILDLQSNLSKNYVKYIYYYNNTWYYFKKEGKDLYPFCMADELMGSYLAKLRSLPTVFYKIAKVEDNYGLASISFKQSGFKYYTLSQLLDISVPPDIENIDILQSFTINTDNKKQFLNHLLNLFALDIHMLQKDRCDLNMQFQINEENNYFDIAPLYDYSNCSSIIRKDIIIPNKIVKINNFTIKALLMKFPEFKECLEFCLNQNMEEIWNQICMDYNFNQNCSEYERIREYYEIKDKSNKRYIKRLIVNSDKN